jgi:hypothetical protein
MLPSVPQARYIVLRKTGKRVWGREEKYLHEQSDFLYGV